MSVRLVKLRGVLEEEAEEIRQLLAAHGIAFYETPAGNWGISMPAIWLEDADDLERAKALLDDYQRERQARSRAEYEQARQAGTNRGLLDVLRENPLRFLAYLALIALVLYLSTAPFLDLGD